MAEQACIGFAAVVGFKAIGLRIAAMMGRYDPRQVDVTGIDLHSLQSVMLTHGTMHPEPCRTRCKGCRTLCVRRSHALVSG